MYIQINVNSLSFGWDWVFNLEFYKNFRPKNFVFYLNDYKNTQNQRLNTCDLCQIKMLCSGRILKLLANF